MAAPAPQQAVGAREEEAIAALADAISKRQTPEDSQEFYKSVMHLFKDLNLTPEAEQRLIEQARQRSVSLRPITRPAEELPPTVNRIRGPANYFERTDGDKKEFITVADGKPYVLFSKAPQEQETQQQQQQPQVPAQTQARTDASTKM